MLTIQMIIAGVAVVALAVRPRSRASAGVAAAAALGSLGLVGIAPVQSAVAATLPMAVFLIAALSLAALVAASGLVERTAAGLSRAADGSVLRLYLWVCAVTCLLTFAVSLDGA